MNPSLAEYDGVLPHPFFRSLPPLRAFLGNPRRAPVVVYSDAPYSVDGRKGLGVIITDVESGARRMCGAEVPLDLLQWMVAALSNALHLRLAGAFQPAPTSGTSRARPIRLISLGTSL